MKITALLAAALLCGIASAQTTVTIPAQSLKGSLADGSTVAVAIAAQTITSSGGVVTPPPVITPPPVAATAWVYHAGKQVWTWDLSFAGGAKYNDVTGVPSAGPFDVQFTVTAQWGGWQIAVNQTCQTSGGKTGCFDISPYSYLVFQMKPTVANQLLKSNFNAAGDVQDGTILYDLSAYCSGGSNPPVGQWETCKVPLSAYALPIKSIFKVAIGDNTGKSANKLYFQEVGFQ